MKRFSKYFKEVEESNQQRAMAYMHSVIAAILELKTRREESFLNKHTGKVIVLLSVALMAEVDIYTSSPSLV